MRNKNTNNNPNNAVRALTGQVNQLVAVVKNNINRSAQQKQKVKRPKNRTRQKIAKVSTMSVKRDRFHQAIAHEYNPFNVPAVRHHTEMGVPTGLFKRQENAIITTGPSGQLYIRVEPQQATNSISGHVTVNNSFTGTSLTTGTMNNLFNSVSIGVSTESAYLVSYGVRLSYIGPVVSRSGVVYVHYQTSDGGDISTDYKDWLPRRRSMVAKIDGSPMLFRCGSYSSTRLRSHAVGTSIDLGDPRLDIVIVGAPVNLACFLIEVVYTLEYIPDKDSMPILAATGAISSDALSQAETKYITILQQFVDKFTQKAITDTPSAINDTKNDHIDKNSSMLPPEHPHEETKNGSDNHINGSTPTKGKTEVEMSEQQRQEQNHERNDGGEERDLESRINRLLRKGRGYGAYFVASIIDVLSAFVAVRAHAHLQAIINGLIQRQAERPQEFVALEQPLEEEVARIVFQEAENNGAIDQIQEEVAFLEEFDLSDLQTAVEEHLAESVDSMNSSDFQDLEDSYRRPDDLSDDRLPDIKEEKDDDDEQSNKPGKPKDDDDDNDKDSKGPGHGKKYGKLGDLYKRKPNTTKVQKAEEFKKIGIRIFDQTQETKRIQRKMKMLRNVDRTTKLEIERQVQSIFKEEIRSSKILDNLTEALRSPERNTVVLRTFDQKIRKELGKQVAELAKYSPPEGEQISTNEVQDFINDYRDGVIEYSGTLTRIRSNLRNNLMPSRSNIFQQQYGTMYANWLALQMRFNWFQVVRQAAYAERQRAFSSYATSNTLMNRAQNALARAWRRPSPFTVTVALGFVLVLAAVPK